MSNTGQFTSKHPPKMCRTCGGAFFKRSTLSRTQWEKKEFCSNACRGASLRAKVKVEKGGRVRVWTSDGLRWRAHVVAEEAIGRRLLPGEVVHHINGDPSDDRPDNLKVFGSHAEHMAAHWQEGTIRRVAGLVGVTEARRASDEWPATVEAEAA